jgi:hypothetical protein
VQLLSSLKRLTISLEAQASYYERPDSEYDNTIPDESKFREHAAAVAEALRSVREQAGPASIFLGAAAIDALEALVRANWSAMESSACTADFVEQSMAAATAAYDCILSEARGEVSKVIVPDKVL